MTDLESFIELYRKFDIELNVIKTDTGSEIILVAPDVNEDDTTKIEGGTISKKFEGYWGFYSKIAFDKDGKFIKQGFWE